MVAVVDVQPAGEHLIRYVLWPSPLNNKVPGSCFSHLALPQYVWTVRVDLTNQHCGGTGKELSGLVATVAELRIEVADRLWATGQGHIRDPAVATAVDGMTHKLRQQSQQLADVCGAHAIGSTYKHCDSSSLT